jgi:hypothetical protein
MVRLLFLIHRYLGIALCIVVFLWCTSGLIMMYVQYPRFTNDEQLQGLAELDLDACCTWPSDFSDIEIDRFRVEMLQGNPVARLDSTWGSFALDIGDGRYLDSFDERQARELAMAASDRLGLGNSVGYLGSMDVDQWTIGFGVSQYSPLYLFEAEDNSRTQLYVSGSRGEVVQMTTAPERFWNWLGAVTHWFYPMILRQHTTVWLNTIIWTTILGLFLTLVGLYIGFKQLKRRRSGRLSPYRGLRLWHHWAGLIFGVLTLTWLFSGLLSLNPWGTLESRSFALEQFYLQGENGMQLSHAQDALAGISAAELPSNTVRLVGTLLNDRLYLTAWTGAGDAVRLDGGTLEPKPLTEAELARVSPLLRPDVPIAEEGLIVDEDAYYYTHHLEMPLPAYRIRYADGERIYLDGTTGELAYAVDTSQRSYRWLFAALHRGDFAAIVRLRPIWDIMMWLLMLGVTVGAATGVWLGVDRIARTLRRFSHRRAVAAGGSS